MADRDNTPKPSIFQKMLDAGHAVLDSQLHKAKTAIVMNQNEAEAELFFGKTVTEDPNYTMQATGWKDRPHRLTEGHLKQISLSDSVISAVIQTRQNQVSNYSKFVSSEKERGWMLCLKDEAGELAKIKEELQAEQAETEIQQTEALANDMDVAKSVEDLADAEETGSEAGTDLGADKTDDEQESFNWELERKAKQRLQEKFKDAKNKVRSYVEACGETKDRPFNSLRWTFDSALRALVRDSLTYDRYAVEIVPDRVNRPHHWFPVDAGTIKFASNRLKDYSTVAQNFLALDLLYPDKQAETMEKQKTVELKPELLAAEAYRYVQVIRGRIERAYTSDELKVGIRNVTTDIFNNGYGISELEMAVGLITGHLNAEFYNQAYFTQGFSAKGILHIQAALNRRKVESVRQQWQHMVRGSRNSFQTPIFAGVEDVKWIPLTQNHNDIGFEGWMRYLIKMICAIYQIDPQEIGIGFREEGTGGGGMSGDNTDKKIAQSKDKGLYPLLAHLQHFLNTEIIAPIDNRFELKFTGVSAESTKEAIERQQKEGQFKKTVNEIRDEDGLPPLPGMDDVILAPTYMQWYLQFSEKGQKAKAAAQPQMPPPGQDPGTEPGAEENPEDDFFASELEPALMGLDVQKSEKLKKKPRKIKVEYYKIGK